MKFDKETLVKHQFWFLLGGYLLIWLIAVMWLMFTAPDTIKAAKGNYEKAEKELKSASSNPVNKNTFLPPWVREAEEFNGHKMVIWKKASDFQAGMYDWPDQLAQKYDMMYPETPITTDDLGRYRADWYPKQIETLRTNAPKFLEPVELLGGFDNIFQPRTEWTETPTREEIWLAQEDLWVKRELLYDVWTTMNRLAWMPDQPIDEKQEPNPDPEHIKARYRFANKNWEITLHLRDNGKGLVIGGDSTIKNVHPSQHPQPLTSAKGQGLIFNVGQDQTRTRFEVRGEPLSFGEARPFRMDKDQRVDLDPLAGIEWRQDWVKTHPIVLSQGFDQTNSPIRRINAIELGRQDCRNYIHSLQPNNALAELDPLPEEPKQDASGGGGSGMGDNPMAERMKNQQDIMKQMMGGAGGMGGGKTAAPGNPTPHNQIERNRYLQPKEQDKKANPPSRHLPLAIQLIVEQGHMHDVLLTLANSRLRTQITQVEARHIKDYKPQTDEEKKGGDKQQLVGRSGAGAFMGPMTGMMGGAGASMYQQRQMQMRMQMQGGGMGGPGGGMDMQMQRQRQMQMQMQMQMAGGGAMMMRNPMAGAMGGGAMGGAFGKGAGLPGGTTGMTDSGQAAINQQDDNLVELTIYGIATLYRFPDKPKPAEQSPPSGATTPDATQQPAGATTPTATPQSGAAPAQNGSTQPDATTQNTSTQPNATQNGATQSNTGTTQKDSTQPNTAPPPNTGPAQTAEPKQPEKPAGQQQPAPPPAPPAPPAGEKRQEK
jgi:hypothetical protein